MTPEESKALDKALEAAKDYADIVFKGSLAEFGGILSDVVGYWRLKNRIRLMLKAKQWLESKGIKPRALFPDIFVPLVEDGGNVSDESIADMFASLLASHLDPAKQDKIHPSYTKVLSQLSPLDAKTMLVFRKYISYPKAREVGLRGGGITVNSAAKELSHPIDLTYLSCLNLGRLGILEHNGYIAPNDHPIPTLFENSPESQRYRISEYGISFCDACTLFEPDNGAA